MVIILLSKRYEKNFVVELRVCVVEFIEKGKICILQHGKEIIVCYFCFINFSAKCGRASNTLRTNSAYLFVC